MITGASRGIGRTIADVVAADGGRVIGLARRAPADDFPGEFVAVDMADAQALRAALADVTACTPVLRLVNNAGVAVIEPLEQASPEALQTMVDVNLRAALFCAQAVLPAMRQAGFGRIVNIGSRAALGKAGRGAYGATKAAIGGLTRTWALELARDGITVNCVAPGPIATEMLLQSYPPGSKAYDAFVATIPVGRFGTPEEVAAACRFFLSKEAGFITGQTLYVCGGLSTGCSS